MGVTKGITASLDHGVILRDSVTRHRGTITLNAPWTLLPAVESAAMAVELWSQCNVPPVAAVLCGDGTTTSANVNCGRTTQAASSTEVQQ